MECQQELLSNKSLPNHDNVVTNVESYIRPSKSQKRQEKALKLKSLDKEAHKKHLKLKKVVLSQEENESRRQKLTMERRSTDARLENALICGLKVCIDLSFDISHNERERFSLCKQLSLSYGILKRALCPVHLHLTSLPSDSELYRGLCKQGVQSWKITHKSSSPWENCKLDSLVMLSPDAEAVLTDFDHEKVRLSLELVRLASLYVIFIQCLFGRFIS